MWSRWRKYYVLPLLLVGCVAPTVAAAPAPEPLGSEPTLYLELEGDPQFTPTERTWIDEAAHNIVQQTRGDVFVRVTYPTEDWDLRALGRPNLVIRGVPEATWVLDIERILDAKIYGYVREHQVVFLFTDRMADHDLFVHVAMHELLHALGAAHVIDPTAIMYPYSNLQHCPTRLNKSDRGEIARLTGRLASL